MELHPSILEIKRDEIEEPTAIKDNQPLWQLTGKNC